MAQHFPASILAVHEDLVFDLRPHWISLVRPFAQALAITAGLAVVWLVVPFSWGPLVYLVPGLLAMILVLAGPARDFTRWATSHFVLTTDRLIRRSGWIAKESIEIPLEKISDVRFRQGVLERMIGAGDLIIESAGRSGQEQLHDARNPERVQKRIYEMKERKLQRQETLAGPVQGSWGPASVADELTKLHDLLERGVLTGREFEEAKARLLRRV